MNTIYIGKKETVDYVLATVFSFNHGDEIVILKARGRSINKCVDVAEIVKKEFVAGLSTDVKIDTDTVANDDGKFNVSSMSIELRLPKKA